MPVCFLQVLTPLQSLPVAVSVPEPLDTRFQRLPQNSRCHRWKGLPVRCLLLHMGGGMPLTFAF